MSEVVTIVEFMLILLLLVMIFAVFMACFLIVDYYVKQFVGMMDSAINISTPISAVNDTVKRGWIWHG